MIAGISLNPLVVENPKIIKEIVAKIKDELDSIYPEFKKSLLWYMPMAWKLVESIVRGQDWYGTQDASRVISSKGSVFWGDSTISYGIGTDSASHISALLSENRTSLKHSS